MSTTFLRTERVRVKRSQYEVAQEAGLPKRCLDMIETGQLLATPEIIDRIRSAISRLAAAP